MGNVNRGPIEAHSMKHRLDDDVLLGMNRGTEFISLPMRDTLFFPGADLAVGFPNRRAIIARSKDLFVTDGNTTNLFS